MNESVEEWERNTNFPKKIRVVDFFRQYYSRFFQTWWKFYHVFIRTKMYTFLGWRETESIQSKFLFKFYLHRPFYELNIK